MLLLSLSIVGIIVDHVATSWTSIMWVSPEIVWKSSTVHRLMIALLATTLYGQPIKIPVPVYSRAKSGMKLTAKPIFALFPVINLNFMELKMKTYSTWWPLRLFGLYRQYWRQQTFFRKAALDVLMCMLMWVLLKKLFIYRLISIDHHPCTMVSYAIPIPMEHRHWLQFGAILRICGINYRISGRIRWRLSRYCSSHKCLLIFWNFIIK